MATGIAVWSTTAATNSGSDSAVNWAEGQAPSSVNDSARGMMAAVAKWRDDHNGTLTTAGSSTVYTLASNQVFGSLTAGYEITFCLDETNGATVTINVDGLGAKPLRPAPGVELAAGQLKAGVPYRATYFTSNSGEWILHGLTDTLIAGATALTAPAIDDELPIYDLDTTTNKKITTADFLKVINVLTEDTTPDADSDFVVTYDASASGPKKVALDNLPAIMPRGHIWGLTLFNNGSDATNDIDIAVGEARDGDNTENMVLASAITKQLDGAWAVGTNQGGLDTGSIANTTYHVHLIKRTDTGVVDVLFSASASSPTMPANYDKSRRIGSILREGGAIVLFVQDGDLFQRYTPILDIGVTNPGTSAVLRALSVPLGLNVRATLNIGVQNNGSGGNAAAYVSDPDTSDLAASATLAPLWQTGANGLNASAGANISYTQVQVRTNTSAQVRTRLSFSDGNVLFRGATCGWYDSRGRMN